MKWILSATILCLVLVGRGFAQISPQLGPNASGVGFYIVSPSCSSQPQVSGANLCFDTVVGQLFSFGGATYSVPTTGSAGAGGTPGSGQYNLAGVLAGLSGTGLEKLNGSSPPTIAVAGTDYQAALTAGAPASTTIGGSGLSIPAANGFLFSNGASPFGLLNLTADQVPVGTAGAPTALSLLNCAADGLHSEVYSTTTHTFSCVTVTASVTAPGTTGSTVWTNGTVLASFAGTGLLKLNGSSSPSIGVSGTDYAPATSGSAIQKGNSSGGFSSAVAGTDYVPPTSVNNVTILSAQDFLNDGNNLALLSTDVNNLEHIGGANTKGVRIDNPAVQNQGTFSSAAFVDSMPINGPFSGGTESCLQNQHDYTLAANPAVIMLGACPGLGSSHQTITYLFSQPGTGSLGSYVFQATQGAAIYGATITSATACQVNGCQDVIQADYYGTRNEWVLNLKAQNVTGVATCPTGQVCYYVDSVSGLDSNSGTSPAAPFATIGKVMTKLASLNPGDQILFKAGRTWTGDGSSTTCGSNCNPPMWLGDVAQHYVIGSAMKPIVISTYGGSGRALIDGANLNPSCINAEFASTGTVQYINISNIECEHTWSWGIYFHPASAGGTPGISINNVYVHNIGPLGPAAITGATSGVPPLWQATHSYPAESLILPLGPATSLFYNQAACTSGNPAPTWTTTNQAVVNDTNGGGNCHWTNVMPTTTPASDYWQDFAPSSAYTNVSNAYGTYIEPETNNAGTYVYAATSACISGATYPASWTQVVGQQTASGTCSFLNTGVLGAYKNQVGYQDDGGGTAAFNLTNSTVRWCGGHNCVEIHNAQGNVLVQNNVVGPGGSHENLDSHGAGNANAGGLLQVLQNVVTCGVSLNLSQGITGQAGIFLGGDFNHPANVLFQGNLAYDCTIGIQMSPFEDGGTTEWIQAKVYNNTLIGAAQTGAWPLYFGTSGSGNILDVRNNILDTDNGFNAKPINVLAGLTTGTEDYNDLGGRQGGTSWTFNGSSTTPGAHDFCTTFCTRGSTIDPSYICELTNTCANFTVQPNYTLQNSSVMIGAGLAGLTQGNNNMGAF